MNLSNSDLSSNSYRLDQKKENMREEAIYTFSKILRFLLENTASFLKSIFKALLDALKLFFQF